MTDAPRGLPMTMNASKARATLESLEAAAQRDELRDWCAENSEAFMAVVRMMRTGEPALATVALFEQHTKGDGVQQWQQVFVEVARTLLDELAQLEAVQPRRPTVAGQKSGLPPAPTLKQVAEFIPLAPNTIEAMERKGEFPPRRTLPAVRGSGPGKRVFVRREVAAWIDGTDWRALVRERIEAGNG